MHELWGLVSGKESLRLPSDAPLWKKARRDGTQGTNTPVWSHRKGRGTRTVTVPVSLFPF